MKKEERQLTVQEVGEAIIRIAETHPNAIRVSMRNAAGEIDFPGAVEALKEKARARAAWRAMTTDEQEHARRVCGYNPEKEWGDGDDYGPDFDPTPDAEGM